MWIRAFLVLLATSVSFTPFASAGPVSPTSEEALAASFRSILLNHMPHPLLEGSRDWGRQAPAPSRLTWRGKGLHGGLEIVTKPKNDGVWRRYRVTAENLPQSLIVRVLNVRLQAGNRTTFDVLCSFDARAHYEQQNWESGVRLWSSSARARLRVLVILNCEMTTRVEKGSWFFPTLVLRLRVLNALVSYDQFVLEHIHGIGGEAAKLIGEAIRKGLHEWKPAIERKLLEKAGAALVRAGDTKEIRIGLQGIRRKK